MTPALLTIGYEACTLGKVVDALMAAEATHLLDVRAVPQSRKPGFSKRLLGATVEEAGLRYVHLRGLGTPKAGRIAARHGDVTGMRAIFDAHMDTDPAQADLANAVSLAAGQRVCLLCFERDHARCHRSIVAGLIAARTGLAVHHLVAEAVAAPAPGFSRA